MDELVAWLRGCIAAEQAQWKPVLASPRRNGKATAREVLARCESHRRLLDFLLGMNDEAEAVGAVVPSLGEKYRERFEHGARLLALSYRHCDGYQESWAPAVGP